MNNILLAQANAIHIPLADKSVHVCVTSPPYFGLRAYVGADGQGGQEVLHDCGAWMRGEYTCGHCYVCFTRAWAKEVHRVLRNDGTFWLNIGDSFNDSGGSGGDYNEGGLRAGQPKVGRIEMSGLKPRDMLGVPWRVAFALQSDGWYLRADMIWAKDNPTPFPLFGWRWEPHLISARGTDEWRGYEQAIVEEMERTGCAREFAANNLKYNRPDLVMICPGCDKCSPNNGYVLRRTAWRPTSSHEYIFLFSKYGKYYADHIAVGEPNKSKPGATKNRRDVVKFTQTQFSDRHFAVFPPGLPELAIKAGTSEAGACGLCGAPFVRVIERDFIGDNLGKREDYDAPQYKKKISRTPQGRLASNASTMGWEASCKCDASPAPSIVLDPFSGSGTTVMVANAMHRRGIGLDLSRNYLMMAQNRTGYADWQEWVYGKSGQGAAIEDLPLFKGVA